MAEPTPPQSTEPPPVRPATPRSPVTQTRELTLHITDDRKSPAIKREAYEQSNAYKQADAYLQKKFSDEVIAQNMPRLPGETESQYKKRAYDEIDKRVRDTGTYTGQDWVMEILSSEHHPDLRELARTIEAYDRQMKVEERRLMIDQLKNYYQMYPQDVVLTEIAELGIQDQAESPYMEYHDAEGKIAPEAMLDMLAFQLVEDKVADVVDPTLAVTFTPSRYPGVGDTLTRISDDLRGRGEVASYRNLRTVLKQQTEEAVARGDEDAAFTLRLTSAAVRAHEYENIRQALQHRRNVGQAPPGSDTLDLTPLPPVVQEMAETLQTINLSRSGIEQLINDYQGFHNEKGTQARKKLMGEQVDQLSMHLFDFALKGQERFKRTAKKPVEPGVPDVVTPKRFREGPKGRVGEPPKVPPAPEPKVPSSDTSIPYYIYGEGATPEELKKIFEERRSPTLKENPKAQLNWRQESQSYFSRQEPAYRQRVQSLAEQIPQPVSKDLRAIVCIPVAGHQEGKNIYNTLTNYTYQDAPRDQFEVLLFVNHPDKDPQGNTIQPDTTISEIERFKREYPDFPVRVITRVMPPDEANIGTIRKYLNDTALYRSLQGPDDTPDILLISNDADNKGLAPTYISNFIKRFDKNPEIDGMLGQLDWDPEAYVQYPLVHLGTRLFQYLGAFGRQRSGRMPSSGANFAFRGSIYAGIGGYLNNIPGGEDVAIGQAILTARGDHRSLAYAGARVSRLYTSARRAIDALQKGLPPVQQWDEEFSVFDDEIRRFQLGQGETINFDDPQQLASFKKGLEGVINATLDVYDRGEQIGKNARYYKSAVERLGIRYDVQDGKVVITKMDTLIRGLKHYQKMAVLLRDIKAGKGTPETNEQLRKLQGEFFAELKSQEAEEQARKESQEQAVTETLSRFNQETRINLPDLPPPAYTFETVSTSTNQVKEGPYLLCLDRPLGSGQMGEIVAGYHEETHEVLAFKRVRREEQEFIARTNEYPSGVLDLEDIIKEKVTNPTLGVYVDKITRDGELIKIYRIEPTDLDKYIETQGNLSPTDALTIAIKLTHALRDLHRNGIVHLDLSPTNVLLTKDGAQLIDFNAGSMKNAQGEYTRGFVGGFRWITPPELFEENPIITESVDTYEVSIMLYKMLAGDYPYHGHSAGKGDAERTRQLYEAHRTGTFSIPDTIPNPIKAILRKGIQPDPAMRYQTATELLTDLLDAYDAVK